ncbi:MAG: ATP-binding cassette domain-containing protein [Acidobacteriota bacterium]
MSEQAKDIVANDVSMAFTRGSEKLTALDSVSLTVLRGSFLSIVGPSGCGKTTLLRILAKLLTPTTGEVWIDPGQLKEGIAYVPQSPLLLPWRTLLQNAALGLELKGKLNAAKVERIKAEIQEFGLGGFEESVTAELSGGMAQRASLIRALESRPRILFCDEPFSAIDFVTRLGLTTRFKLLCGVHNMTTVFVTHNIEEAIFLGDQVAVMSGRPGKIVATHHPNLSIGSEDAVACRQAPEFAQLFAQIWEELKNGSA